MKKITFYIATLALCSACSVDYSVEYPDYTPPEIVTHDTSGDTIRIDSLPEPGAMIAYSPSLLGKPYRPIKVRYSSQEPPIGSWTEGDTRIIAFMGDYQTSVKTEKDYTAFTNKYGSNTTLPKQTATGRFYTKQISGRWWLVDPEGYLHYERSVTSFRKGSSTRNAQAWAMRFGTNESWLATTQRELASIGVHGTGAFCTDAYDLIQAHNTANPGAPLTLMPSFGFLSAFRSSAGLAYPGGDSENAIGLVLSDKWADFCKNYVATTLKPYLKDPNTIGIYSDNEINFSTQNSRTLDRFLKIADKNDPAYLHAQAFLDEKKTTSVTDVLNDEYCGRLAELYYKGVKEGITANDPDLLYLGTRLHGTPKYMENVIKAAGKYCDIISINYYSRWSPELTTWVKNWGDWTGKPFIVTEFYTKGIYDSDLANGSGAGFSVPTQKERAYAYQHFTLGLLEAKNCIGWTWFKYQDDDTGSANSPANKGMYDNYYNMFPYLTTFMKELNYNAYDLINYFDN
jgi:hypothetical protein